MVNFGDLSNLNIRTVGAAQAQSSNAQNTNKIFKSNFFKNIFPDSDSSSFDDIENIEEEYTKYAELAGKINKNEDSQSFGLENIPNDYLELAFKIYSDIHAEGEKNLPELSILKSAFNNGGYKEVIDSDKVKIEYLQKVTDDYINKRGGARDIPEYYALSQEFKQTEEYKKINEFLNSTAKYAEQKSQSNHNIFASILKKYLSEDSKKSA